MPKSIKYLYYDAKSDVNTLERIDVVIVNSKQKSYSSATPIAILNKQKHNLLFKYPKL